MTMDNFTDILSVSLFITGFLTILAGSLYASLWLFGKCLKLFGMWNDTARIMRLYFIEKNKRRKRDD